METNNPILTPTPRKLTAKSQQPGWPEPLAADALYALPGKVVSTIDPHTESDPVAILVQFLIAFGNLIGPFVHFIVDGKDHYMNLFAVLVGGAACERGGGVGENWR